MWSMTTHERWKREVETGTMTLVSDSATGNSESLWSLTKTHRLEQVFVRQPEDVSRLASRVGRQGPHRTKPETSASRRSRRERRHYRRFINRMREVKDNANAVRPTTPQTSSLMPQMRTRVRCSPTRTSASRLADILPQASEWSKRTSFGEPVKFLKAAAQGRVFYSRDSGGCVLRLTR